MTRRGLVFGLIVASACKSMGTKVEVDAQPPAVAMVASNAPKSFGKLTSASLVEVRETSDVEGRCGDVVFKLTRAGDHFDWDGKGVPFADSLGERLPDPLSRRQCSCDVMDACTRCDDVPVADVQRTSGRTSAASVEAFLTEVVRHGWAPEGDAGVFFDRHTEKVHVAVTIPGEEPVHLSFFDTRRLWSIDDRLIAGDKAPLDAAWERLRTDLGIPSWLAKMNPKVEPLLPPDFGDLGKAAIVEIHDEWNGLGLTHDEVVRLERNGTGFDWRAKIASYAGSLGETMADPYSPKEKYSSGPCTCDVDSTCPCEHAFDLSRKKGTTPAATVESFLNEVARHTIDPSPPPIGRSWTDDYPKGHVVVWVTGASAPIHLSFLDQQRQWRANGRVLSPDPAKPDTFRTQHDAINGAYRAMLTTLGQSKWVDEIHKAKPPIQPIRRR